MKNIASRLRQRITIETPVYTSDLLGGFITAWNIYAVLWAEVIPQAKGSRFVSEKTDSTNLYKMTIRYIPDINTKMRVLYKSRHYAIRSVVNADERNERLDLIVSEVM